MMPRIVAQILGILVLHKEGGGACHIAEFLEFTLFKFLVE